MNENRQYPRIQHVTPRQIIRLDESQNPQKNFILTANLSGSGIKFNSNETLPALSYFLIYLHDLQLKDVHVNGKNLLKTGNFYMSKVVWTNQIRDNLYEIGAAFVEKTNSNIKDIDTFVELVNISMLDTLPETSNKIL